ncbi:MAG TPA: hypothetical protein VK989_13395, partial [Polyangia bacterium]|nr:hypothetical protein [Polyangia bacterium]
MSRVRVIGLVGALLALGCSDASTTPDAGGSSGGSGSGSDASGAAGASGTLGDGAAGAGFCADFQPCGGNLVGTWQADERCNSAQLEMAGVGCQGEVWDASGLTQTPLLAFRADGTMTFSSSVSGSVTMTTPNSCLVVAGTPLACTDASAGTMYKQISYPGGKVDSTTCAPTADGLCKCTYVLVAAPISASGAYSVTGTQLKTFVSSELDDFCVTGSTLKLLNKA